MGDRTTAVLYVENISAGPEAAARLFTFSVPENSDFTITPTSGRVLPGQVLLMTAAVYNLIYYPVRRDRSLLSHFATVNISHRRFIFNSHINIDTYLNIWTQKDFTWKKYS